MKLLFVSGLIPEKYREVIACQSKIPVGGAADVFQKALVEGFVSNDADVDIITFPGLGCFPHHYKKLYTPQGAFPITDGKTGKLRRYCTLVGLKDQSVRHRAYRDIKRWLDAYYYANDRIVVLTYNMDAEILCAVKRLKRQFPNIVVSTIVTDLVDDFFNPVYKRSFLKTIQLRHREKTVRMLYSLIDKFILLSLSMQDKIPQSVGKSILVEGISSAKGYNFIPKEDAKLRSVIYTGSLGNQTSIKELVDAFVLTSNPDFRLIICGSGLHADYIKNKAKEDDRIVFKGFVTHEEAMHLQRSSTAVINPRKPTISLTRYSFPSKTMEYMSSGTPMIGYKLGGIPDEYYDYMYTVDGLMDEDLAKTIIEVLTKPQDELNAKAKAAMEFIRDNKTTKIQVGRILKFLEN